MQGDQTVPYLSIVVTSRNDNHGGDMLKRMRIFVKVLIRQCNIHKLPCELIFVEWNPLKNEQLLNKILPSVGENDFLTIRYIIVPEEIHKTFNFSERIPLFQMIAKNVGLRRAKAEFVLCTNVDIIFSDELFEELAKRNLKHGVFYRANRCDVPNSLNEEWPVEKQLQFCETHIKKRLGKNRWYPNFKDPSGFLLQYKIFFPLVVLLSKIKSTFPKTVNYRYAELDFEACGDFTLMSKKNWVEIEGYPELEIYSIHIDSMGIMAAAALKMKQVLFESDACTYHMEHSGGWEFSNPLEKIYFYAKKPMLEWWAVRDAGIYLMENNATFKINKDTWGLADKELQEIKG